MIVSSNDLCISTERFKNNEELIEEDIYRTETIKALLPQFYAATVAGLHHLTIGMTLAFSGILIPNLEKEDSYFLTSSSILPFIASSSSLGLAIGGLCSGYMADKLGRISVLRLLSIPQITGWILIATSSNEKTLLIGRILTGFSAALAIVGSGSFIGEISFPKIRPPLLILMSLTSSTGVLLVYLEGLLMSWKWVAWTCCFYTLVLFLLTFTIIESPVWLIRKGKYKLAKSALKYIHKYQNNYENLIDIHYRILKRGLDCEQTFTIKNYFMYLFKPGSYKPLFILIGLEGIQQFSGIYVITGYAVTFFEDINVNIHPLVASNIVTCIPIFTSLLNMYITTKVDRKTLLTISCIGVTICLYSSALFTKWIRDGTTEYKWVPVALIFFYMAIEMIGLEPLTWDLMSEIFPFEIRGLLMGLSSFTMQCFMFFAIQTFQPLASLIGMAGIQLFYGSVALIGVVYVYIFIPETRKKSFEEIQKYFTK